MNHGHVTPNADGSKARCGGPGLCAECSSEAATVAMSKVVIPTQPSLHTRLVEVIYQWKHAWMNQRQNDEADYQNYFRRAFGVDANMIHSLADRIEKELEKK